MHDKARLPNISNRAIFITLGIVIILSILCAVLMCNTSVSSQATTALYAKLGWMQSKEFKTAGETYANVFPNINPMNPRLFVQHNLSQLPFRDDYLTLTRIENRRFLGALPLHEDREKSICILNWTLHPLIQNYVKISYKNKERILELPMLPGMHEKVPWYQQYEDPRLYIHKKSGRIFFTSTVFTTNNLRMALVEIDNETLKFKNGFVLSDNFIPETQRKYAQKNWNLFSDVTGQPFIITEIYPHLVVYSIDLENGHMQMVSKIDTSEMFQDWSSKNYHIRCSSGAINYNTDSLLFGMHIVHLLPDKKIYRNFFVETFNTAPFQPKRKSRLFSFTNDVEDIEFNSGLCWNQNHDQIRVCLGIGDRDHTIVSIPPDSIFDPSYRLYETKKV